jgi:hypothetical protein
MVVVDLHLSGHILHKGDNPNEKKDFVYLEEHFKHVPQPDGIGLSLFEY